ncbi:hypothetical protein G4177_19930 [Corallococcus sp. ZKHCc1 1396]|uniref:Uncharacterized protein n=1 Tax=Corallococcus soli TaxID=2710757 RepID=A0ABR9PR88_9BACT|nr:hypothetical protein [Corallococcus soli]MBE4750441.1 hypothetical protein [Corallococcus soli]
MVLLITGCASVRPLYGNAHVLKDSARAAPSPVPRLAVSEVDHRQSPGESSRLRRHRSERPQGTEAAPVARSEVAVRAVDSGAVEADAFERLLVFAGLEPWDEMPLRESPLTTKQAERLLSVLLKKPVTPGNFPPRMGASLLLREVLAGGTVSREELLRRVARFNRAVVLRPDGYLAWVLTGRTQQRVAPVEWKEGVFGALGFELGRFYLNTGGVFRPADEHLQPVFSSFVVEVYDDADVINRSLDGAGEAFFELAMAVGKFFTAPTDSVLALQHLPEGLAALLAASPEYLERFTYMTRGEQIQAVAKLVTTLYACGGIAKGTTSTVTAAMGGAEAMVPGLSLSAQGALVLERVAVPVGGMASSVRSGVGGLYVLSSASSSTGSNPHASASASATDGRYKNVEIVDARGDPLGEFDEIQPGLFIEDKSARNLEVLHPRTGKPMQTAEQWAMKQIYEKTTVRLRNLMTRANATRPAVGGTPVVPAISELKAYRRFLFRIEEGRPALQEAVTRQLARLTEENPGWTFSATYGP